MVNIFIENLHPKIALHLQLQCVTTFYEVIENGLTIEKALIVEGVIKIYKDQKYNNQTSNKKPKYWSKNKNVVNDGVTNNKRVQNIQNTPSHNSQQQGTSKTITIPQGKGK